MSTSEDLPVAITSSLNSTSVNTENLDVTINNTTIMEVKTNTWYMSTGKMFSCYYFTLRAGNAPTNASDTGTAGDIRWNSGYLYVCVATNTWKRIVLSWTNGYAQLGSIRLGTGYTATTNLYFGRSVAISRDGLTAAVGASGDNSNRGAVWVYVKSGNDWVQQGSKLIPVNTSTSGSVYFGSSVSLSANGNVLAVGGNWHQAGLPSTDRTGGVWVFKRTDTTWNYDTILEPVGYTGGCQMGTTVMIDDSGTTIAGGAPINNNYNGAVWIFKDNAGWSIEGTLINADLAGAQFGKGLAFSGDGNILCIGGPNLSNSYNGTVWTYDRSGGVWSERGSSFQPPDSSQGLTGERLAISSNGLTLAISSSNDGGSPGSVFVYNYSAGWNLEQKIVPDNNVGDAAFGTGVSISTDGNTLAIGGPSDNTNVGAFWVYTRSGSTWTKLNKFTASDETGAGKFGDQISMTGDAATIIIGGRFDGGQFANSGGAWFFAT